MGNLSASDMLDVVVEIRNFIRIAAEAGDPAALRFQEWERAFEELVGYERGHYERLFRAAQAGDANALRDLPIAAERFLRAVATGLSESPLFDQDRADPGN